MTNSMRNAIIVWRKEGQISRQGSRSGYNIQLLLYLIFQVRKLFAASVNLNVKSFAMDESRR
jgi:hypothetical protein